ncbi:homocysteine-responsive endoplasmic reticulum-resident ubiquitin-like domain member 2 protein [Musca vetustissima]|uniref:homocysteine-responsive endoplasmic reticulum-resident ubiquitin-like domain member 2 protein n=1 Tax=Musca vetustissima TaxID=27455 RepID=UPI002AB7CFDF|nr:homocysteine-responsive endoplasmic reticulum-resident ubiquitin-like domain member 2 protein [Musca vetustissima]
MDDTNNSSSAAFQVAGSKQVMDVAPTNKSPSYVKLLIKASNQQYDDQIIESDLSWTVKRLKSHLALVYPSKPPAADQKLIYSGQLLNDNLQLKDVIRSYKDVYTHNHIIHLVYTPKNLPPVSSSAAKAKSKSTSSISAGASSMSSDDGLRQRHATASAVNASTAVNNQNGGPNAGNPMGYYSQYLPQTAVSSGGADPPLTVPGYSQFNMQALAMQQAAMYTWMQQVYSQYMEQCLRVYDTNSTGAAGTLLQPFSTFPQNPFLPQFPQTVISNVALPATPTANTATEHQQPAQEPEQQPAQAQVAAPRFPNMPQEEADNRDWLDNIFSITRLALFLTILYFNSSPLRCLAVVIIAGGIYLYHIGVFRLRHERNNNNLNRNNNAVQNAAVDQIRQGVNQQQPQAEQPNDAPENNVAAPAPAGNNNEPPTNAANSNAAVGSENVANENNESMISTLRTFVVTFFTSLLPETPAI